ncbi:MAG: hypothetical protein Fur0010_05010 [Bdellovibrio sp.]
MFVRLFFIAFCLIIIVSACGVKEQTSAPANSEFGQFLGPEAYHCPQNSDEDQTLSIKINSLSLKVSRIYGPVVADRRELEKFSNQHPMKANKKLIMAQINEIERLLEKTVSKENYLSLQNNGVVMLKEESQMSEIRVLESRINRLKKAFKRWQDRRCVLKDIKDHEKWSVLTSKAYLSSRSDFVSFDQLSDGEQIELCDFFHATPVCLMEQKMRKKQRNYIPMLREYSRLIDQNKVKEFFEPLSSKKFICQKENDQIILTVALQLDAEAKLSFTELNDLYLAEVAKAWSGDKFKLKIVFSEELNSQEQAHVVAIKSVKQRVSHVISNQNVIYLNEKLTGHNLIKVLAHELGHTFGFPDCYVEYFDRKKAELVYFEIGENSDIMCSLEGEISASSQRRDFLAQSCLTTH